MDTKDPPYDPSQFPRFAVTTDIVLFTLRDRRLHVLLIRRKESPFAGQWALPGGFVRPDETLAQSAKRELAEETGVEGVALTQFQAFGEPGRDPRETAGAQPLRIVTVGYTALVPGADSARIVLHAQTDAAEADWHPTGGLPQPLAFDHAKILDYALAALRRRLEEGRSVAEGLLPTRFTLTEMQEVYEALRGEAEDKRNFRKWVISQGWVTPTEGERRGAHRPAQLYEFTPLPENSF